MKPKSTFLTATFFLFLGANLFAQNFWVPDSNFRIKLKQLYPTCFTAQDSLITNCSLIQNETDLDVEFENISDLSGISFFTSLTKLSCD